MKSKKIYLIRHGQTELNRLGIVQGSGVDAELNDTGFRQARAFFEHYKHVPFDKVYTSSLKRTIQSVQDFLEMGLPHEAISGLNEISWGKNEGHKVSPERDAYYNYMIEAWSKGEVHLRIEGGESPLDVFERQKPALDLILSRKEEENILICMHGRAMRILLCQLLNYPLKDMDVFQHENLCLYKISFTGSMFSVDAYCDVEHLSEITEKVH